MPTLILFNKPFKVMSQFTAPKTTSPTQTQSKETLANYIAIPKVYPAGRLDFNSEGLLLLTDNGKWQHRIAHPKQKLEKSYWALVEGTPNNTAIKQLQNGITLKDGPTKPAKVQLIDPPVVWDRPLPPKYNGFVTTSWLEITITEGRNRQVRRMTAHVGHPTVRLVRHRIGPWTIDNLQPGEFSTQQLKDHQFNALLS